MDSDAVRALIVRGIPGCKVDLESDGRHFRACVISEAFAGKSLLQQHQMVYGTLGEQVGKEIHALSIKTFTPEQWERETRSD